MTRQEYQDMLEARKVWITALRSGKYPQGRGGLNLKGGLCCLGVGCEALGLPKKLVSGGDKAFSYEDNLFLPPQSFVNKVGLRDHRGGFKVFIEVSSGACVSSLVSCNDNLRATFSEIADLLEQRPDLMFLPAPDRFDD